MKLKHLLPFIILTIIVSSCGTTSFYQIYNVKPTKNTITKNEKLLFEDENCIIQYNLWADGGNIGFQLYNKTDAPIYVKLHESNFVLNGIARDYFLNRTFTNASSSATTTTNSITGTITTTRPTYSNGIFSNSSKLSNTLNYKSSVGHSVSRKEDSIVYIPPRTSKNISEYTINKQLIRNCDLYKYPSRKKIKTKSYTLNESPIVFSNIINYTTKGRKVTVQNEFYVSEITNYPYSEFFELRKNEFCNQKSSSSINYFKFYDTDKFYIEYKKGKDIWKH